MEVQEQESLGRWDGLCSRDVTSRIETMENIRQAVMKKIEVIKPIPSGALSPSAAGSPPNSDLNDTLAHLLMLSKRCPFEDVRARSARLLQMVQVGGSHTPPWSPELLPVTLLCSHLLLSSSSGPDNAMVEAEQCQDPLNVDNEWIILMII